MGRAAEVSSNVHYNTLRRVTLTTTMVASFAAGHAFDTHAATKAVACPKLDQNQETYLTKVVSLIDDAQIASLDCSSWKCPVVAAYCALPRRRPGNRSELFR